jgi:hypothetical protein
MISRKADHCKLREEFKLPYVISFRVGIHKWTCGLVLCLSASMSSELMHGVHSHHTLGSLVVEVQPNAASHSHEKTSSPILKP